MGRFTYTIEDRTGFKHYGSASSIADARALADFHDPNPGTYPRVIILREGRRGGVSEVPRRPEPRKQREALCVCGHRVWRHGAVSQRCHACDCAVFRSAER